jgi:hypothetical protein
MLLSQIHPIKDECKWKSQDIIKGEKDEKKL